jgi:hypothetical protein
MYRTAVMIVVPESQAFDNELIFIKDSDKLLSGNK